MPTQGDDGRSERSSAVSIERLHQQLQDGIDAIESGEDWRAWLDFARRLHRYSFNNLILIWTQCPDATSIASYRTWQSVHRQVRRGEHALRVMAPILRRVTLLDGDGRAILGPDGHPQRRQQVVGFRPAAVFDIGQTEGPAIPELQRPALLAGAAPTGLWEALAREVSERGYRLLRAGLTQLNGANGVTKTVEREVWVRDDVDDAQAAKTLAHELAHVILHADPTDAVDTVRCAGIREVEAESVAHLVLAAHGVETADYSFPYVAAWAYPLAAVEHVAMSEIVARTGVRVMSTARDLIDLSMASADVASEGDRALATRVVQSTQRTAELREGLALPRRSGASRAALLGVVADAHDYLRRCAPTSWVPAYLAARGIEAALETHELGYAPQGWTVLTDHLRGLGYTDEHIEAAGVAARARNGHLIDHLRDRLIIPLRNPDGHVVGFSARANPRREGRSSEPKYVNTRATELFHKAEILFGLSEHRAHLQDGRLAVLCEGPIDAIAIDTVAATAALPLVGLASSGTAFTEPQARQLLRTVEDRTVCLAFDADPAGLAACEKAWRTLTEAQPRRVLLASLPSGTDPATMLVQAPNALATCVRDARPAAFVLAEWKVADAHLEGNAGRELMAFRELAGLAGRLPTTERTAYVLHVADLLNVEATTAAAEVGERYPQLLEERDRTTPPGCTALREMLRQEPAQAGSDVAEVRSNDAVVARVARN